MTIFRALVVVALLGFTAWLGYGAWLVYMDLRRRVRWHRKHFHWRRGNERWMARWTE